MCGFVIKVISYIKLIVYMELLKNYEFYYFIIWKFVQIKLQWLKSGWKLFSAV